MCDAPQEQFCTGAVRDTSEGKIRPDRIPVSFLRELGAYFADNELPPDCRLDLIPPTMLVRLGCLYGRGAKHYGDRNWERGIPDVRCIQSAWRHFLSFVAREDDEDHAAAVIFNIAAVIHWEETGRNDMLTLPRPEPPTSEDPDNELPF